MTRKQFLLYIGIFVLTLSGISEIMKKISNISTLRSTKTTTNKKRLHGFGNGPYGGVKT